MADDGTPIDRRGFIAALLAAADMALAIPPARAGRRGRDDRKHDDDDDKEDRHDDDDEDHDAARRARASGEIAPLSEILEQVRRSHAGEVIEVELDREGSRWLYEIKLITPANRYLEIYVDAKTKTILKVEGE